MNMGKSTATACAFSLLFLDLVIGIGVMAEESQSSRISQSIESPAGVTDEEQRRLLNASPLQIEPGLALYGSRKEGFDRQQKVSAHVGDSQHFRVYDAETLLSRDEDEDGFYSRLRVTFDADVDQGSSDVYARLYISFEGGPWNHYYTTGIFHIHEDRSIDNYKVVTQMLDGYPSGYYDVLIELYEADWDSHVTSYGPYEDAALSALPLEDRGRDTRYSTHYGGGGSFGVIGLALLGLVGGVRRLKSTDRLA